MSILIRSLAVAAVVLVVPATPVFAGPPRPANQSTGERMQQGGDIALGGAPAVSVSDSTHVRNAGAELALSQDAGDINLNGIPNEVSDAILFSRYFVFGLQAFYLDRDAQIDQTDVNGDGQTISVGDLVYMIRIISQ